ncbi:hypothetical protein ACF09J_14735 [Streptomyces sp. NPDC014889]|uniref:hypothetical protein n=1 Tax=Streptomyces sp. NPDC014889 TaxID=3364928 RepID=UPI0036F570C1
MPLGSPSGPGTRSRSDRDGIPAPGCLIALMAPLVAVALIAGTLMFLAHRQDRANERHEKAALERMARLTESYVGDLSNEARTRYPSEARTRGLARQNHGTLVSYTQSTRSLTTVVQFVAAYDEAVMFGSSHSQVHRCYSFLFEKDAEGGLRKRTTPLESCPPLSR